MVNDFTSAKKYIIDDDIHQQIYFCGFFVSNLQVFLPMENFALYFFT